MAYFCSLLKQRVGAFALWLDLQLVSEVSMRSLHHVHSCATLMLEAAYM